MQEEIFKNIKDEDINPNTFYAMIEISKGSRNKYEFDPDIGFLRLDRILSTSTVYPANYGFIPKTLSEDNDPLDVLILTNEEILPMSIVRCKPIGVLKMVDDGEVDEKIIAVCINDPFYSVYNNTDELPKHIFEEIQHFFKVYKTLENKVTSVGEIYTLEEAKAVILRSIKSYKDSLIKK